MAETIRLLAAGLAEAFVRGRWESKELAARAKSVLVNSRRANWVTWLARRLVVEFPGKMPPRSAKLVQFMETDESLLRMCAKAIDNGLPFPEIDISRLTPAEMQPAAGAASTWNVLPLVTTDEVANWLKLTHNELDWFTNCRHRECQHSVGPLRHYRYRWIDKATGGRRLLEIPKPRLKVIQRKILDEILSQIVPHPAAHAFRRGRSIASYVAPHTNKRIILYTDLREFFPSVRASQVHAIFRTAGYPERVATVLTGLCTHVTPRHVVAGPDEQTATNQRSIQYRSPHLPQGAPTSPALANLAAFWLDCRLNGLAQKVGADYTRYADDLVFSGGPELARCSSRFRILVAAIVHNEGFEIRRRKTREMLSGSRQQVSGIILNQHLNIPRQEYDTLRAILHNCQKRGPAAENIHNLPHFREHLLGRLSYWSSICPERIAKLNQMFDQIVWT